MNMDETAIVQAVKHCVASSLALQEDEVQLDSRLIDDLGADSLDFIDILFSLEKALARKLRNEDIDGFLRAEFSEKNLVLGQFVPRAEIDRLLYWMPLLQKAKDLDKVTPKEVFAHISVETFVRIAQSAGKPQGAS